MPPRPFPMPPIWPSELKPQALDIRASVTGATAKVTLEYTFQNVGGAPAEGTFLFPIPKGVTLDKFSILMNGQEIGGEILNANEARNIYESIVRRRRDPAILEFAGDALLSAKVFPVPPGQTRTLRILYTQVVPKDGGLYRLLLPVKAPTEVPPQKLHVAVSLSTSQPLKTIYSPTHSLSIRRTKPTAAEASFEGGADDFRQNVALYYSTDTQAVDVNLLTFKESDEDGFFLLTLSPGLPDVADEGNKSFVFVLDTSGSMAGDKLEQAKAALNFVLSHLKPADRFDIVAFSSDVRTFAEGPVTADADALSRARRFVDRLEAVGGTNISDALSTALRMESPRSLPRYVVFLTDGQPTEGTRDHNAILDGVGRLQRPAYRKARIFVFGVGDDVNVLFLDRLAQANGGVSDYVQPQEDIEVKVSNLYTQIQSPVLTAPELNFPGLETYDVYPSDLTDLFGGSQIVVTGRYGRSGRGTVRLKGMLKERPREFSFPVTFPVLDDERTFIPRVWATQKIGHLLDEIRLKGETAELVESVKNLSRKYGILTPYTAFLVQEPGMPMPVANESARALGGSFAAGGLYDRSGMPPATPAPTGAAAQKASSDIRQLKEAGVAGGGSSEKVKTVGNRTFYLRNGRWEQAEYKDQPTRKIKFLSDEYFGLLAKHEDLKDVLAIGDRLVFLFGKEYVEVIPDDSGGR